MPDASHTDDAGRASDEAFECSYCDRVFAEQEWRALHHGIEHPGRLGDEERAAYEAAHEAETEELRLFRLKALAALVLLYFLFVMAYAVFA